MIGGIRLCEFARRDTNRLAEQCAVSQVVRVPSIPEESVDGSSSSCDETAPIPTSALAPEAGGSELAGTGARRQRPGYWLHRVRRLRLCGESRAWFQA